MFMNTCSASLNNYLDHNCTQAHILTMDNGLKPVFSTNLQTHPGPPDTYTSETISAKHFSPLCDLFMACQRPALEVHVMGSLLHDCFLCWWLGGHVKKTSCLHQQGPERRRPLQCLSLQEVHDIRAGCELFRERRELRIARVMFGTLEIGWRDCGLLFVAFCLTWKLNDGKLYNPERCRAHLVTTDVELANLPRRRSTKSLHFSRGILPFRHGFYNRSENLKLKFCRERGAPH